MNKKILIILSVFVLFSTAVISGSWSQADGEQFCTKFIKGTVSNIDWVGNKLVVRIEDLGNPDEIVVMVPGDAVVNKGADSISFADINIGDNVAVEYYCNTFAGLRARIITVNE